MAGPDDPAGSVFASPWSSSPEEVAAALDTDLADGLSADESHRRLHQHGPNRLEAAPPQPRWRRLLAQLEDPLVYLLLASVAVSLVAWFLDGRDGVPFDAIVIVAIVVANGVLGYVQEARAAQAVAALQRMAAVTAEVIRDGRRQQIDTEQLVPGDVLVLSEGDAIAADARLAETAALKVSEAMLTGESEAVVKRLGAVDHDAEIGDRQCMVFSGTAVAAGRGRAVVTATGMATEMGKIARLLERTDDEPTPLQREVGRIGRLLGLAVVVIAVIVVGAVFVASDVDTLSDVVDVLLVGVSLAVAAVPEGLPALLSVVLALGVQRMARDHAIVKRLSSVETLGSASVICTDKTGTLTRNEMTVTTIVSGSGETEVTGTGYRPDGELRAEGHLLEEARSVVGGGSLASDARLDEAVGGTGGWTVSGDPTEIALLVASVKAGGHEDQHHFRRLGEVPFTSERKLMSTIHTDERDGSVVLLVKGAPDVLLGRCTHERVAGQERPLDDRRRGDLAAHVERLADRALRTLAVAYRPLSSGAESTADPEQLERDLVYLGLVGMIDPPRPEASTAVAAAHRAGIRVMMITGDHPRTALRIAEDLGIASAGSRVLTGAELSALDDEQLTAALQDVSVFARVSPEHKLRIVETLQDRAEIVAMTGDGVNDAPALRAADIGVAMGINGTDVAKEAADMILADDDFATIVAAVREGRSIVANIRTFLRYLLSSNAAEVLTMFLGVVFAGPLGLDAVGVAVPLLATQILWINLLTDSAPALAMGFDAPPHDVMDVAPRRLEERIIDRRMQSGILFVGVVMAAVTLVALDLHLPGGFVEGRTDLTEARTMAFTTLVLAQLFNCFNARSDTSSAFTTMFSNGLLWAAVGVSALLQVAVVHVGVLNDAFGTTPLSVRSWAICVGLASVVLWAVELRKLVARWRVGAGGTRASAPRP